MLESITFSKFKALRRTTLPLSPFTLLLGPNGSGKTTVLNAIQGIGSITAGNMGFQRPQGAQIDLPARSLRSLTASGDDSPVSVQLRLSLKDRGILATYSWNKDTGQLSRQLRLDDGQNMPDALAQEANLWLARMQSFSLDPDVIGQPFPVTADPLQPNGAGLVSVLDNLKDNYPERWEGLLAELREWLPEYDHILFDKPQSGQKRLALRTAKGGYRIPASDLSQGTLVALALLTLAHLPNPPSLVALEEIDRGLHPRLLRHLQDALYRLSFPKTHGDDREPVQVLATTHSPYLLDLYRAHPEEVVLMQKKGLEVEAQRLADIKNFSEILGDSPLSEVWYSGVLGGVTVRP
jgi:hypothetical protein